MMTPVRELGPERGPEHRVDTRHPDDAIMHAAIGIADALYKRRQTEMDELVNVNIEELEPIVSPMEIVTKLPLSEKSRQTVRESRLAVESIIQNPTNQSRLIAVVGPCSIHDPEAGVEYAHNIVRWREMFGDRIEVIMRSYFEKPRTTVGWEGLIEDPGLDRSYNKNLGLFKARKFISDITNLGAPAATELVNTDTPQYIDDGVTLGAIGARTTESQVHRKLASGVSFATGFKNGTGGSVQIAIDAMISAHAEHYMDGTDMLGRRTRFLTKGNQHTFLILRGGSRGPNFQSQYVEDAMVKMRKAGLTPTILGDCSHQNKIGKEQTPALISFAEQIAAGNSSIIGNMLESNLLEGKQDFKAGVTNPGELKKGFSITDHCESAESTEEHLKTLHEAVGQRMAIKN